MSTLKNSITYVLCGTQSSGQHRYSTTVLVSERQNGLWPPLFLDHQLAVIDHSTLQKQLHEHTWRQPGKVQVAHVIADSSITYLSAHGGDNRESPSNTSDTLETKFPPLYVTSNPCGMHYHASPASTHNGGRSLSYCPFIPYCWTRFLMSHQKPTMAFLGMNYELFHKPAFESMDVPILNYIIGHNGYRPVGQPKTLDPVTGRNPEYGGGALVVTKTWPPPPVHHYCGQAHLVREERICILNLFLTKRMLLVDMYIQSWWPEAGFLK